MPTFFTKEEICRYLAIKQVPAQPSLTIVKVRQEQQIAFLSHLLNDYEYCEVGKFPEKDKIERGVIYFNKTTKSIRLRDIEGYVYEADLKQSNGILKSLMSEDISDSKKGIGQLINIIKGFEVVKNINEIEWKSVEHKKQIPTFSNIVFPVTISEYSDDYCKCFGVSSDNVWGMESLSREDIKDLGAVLDISNTTKRDDFVNSLEKQVSNKKTGVFLGRVIVEGDDLVCHWRIEKYKDLIKFYLEFLVTTGEVLKVSDSLYALPKRFNIYENQDDEENDKSDYSLRRDRFPFLRHKLEALIQEFSCFWAYYMKEEHKQEVADINIYKFKNSVSETIEDCMCRGELKGHMLESGKLIECNRFCLLYWSEITKLLQLNGIYCPDEKEFLVWLKGEGKRDILQKEMSSSPDSTEAIVLDAALDIIVENVDILDNLVLKSENPKPPKKSISVLVMDKLHNEKKTQYIKAVGTYMRKLKYKALSERAETYSFPDQETKEKILAWLKNRNQKARKSL